MTPQPSGPARLPRVAAALRRGRPVRLYAHHPKLLIGYAALETASERSSLVDERLKHLAQVRAAMVCGCEWCLDFGSSISEEAGVGERTFASCHLWSSERFSELEKAVLDYATGCRGSPVDVPDELFDRLRHSDEYSWSSSPNMIALENTARGQLGLGIEAELGGAFCVPPEARGRWSRGWVSRAAAGPGSSTTPVRVLPLGTRLGAAATVPAGWSRSRSGTRAALSC